MDTTLPKFDDFPSYVSCIKNYGRPILPPLLSSAQRQEMVEIRHQAIIAEARISRRSIQKSKTPSLMDKANEIMEKIEKSQTDLLEHVNNNGSGDHLLGSSHQGPSTPVHCFLPCAELPSPEQGDNLTNVTLSFQQNSAENNQVLSYGSGIQGTDTGLSEKEDSCSQSSVCEDVSNQAICSVSDYNSFAVIPSACDEKPIFLASDGFSESHLPKNFKTPKFQITCFPLDDSEGSESNIISSEGDECTENDNSSSAHKTSDLDETENASMATVILRSCDELPDDTDSDSIITSAAQSTDLEKYFDSPGDCQLSENSEKIESGDQNDCSIRSISSDFESSSTLVNSDAELTPIPCFNSSVASRNSSRCESRNASQPFISNSVPNPLLHEGKKQGTFQTHVRRSSYTLEQPSPALLQAIHNGNCDIHAVDSETSPYGNYFEKRLLCLETVLSESVCLVGEISDQCAENSIKSPSDVDQWAYKVTHDFCDNSELYDEPSAVKDTCDTSENLCCSETVGDNLCEEEVVSAGDTCTAFNSLPDSFNTSQARAPESAFETNENELHSFLNKEVTPGFSHSLFPEKLGGIDDITLTQIFQNLQEFQKQQVEKLQEEQRQQWEKLHLEFQEQEKILHEQLKSLYVSHPSDCLAKDECYLEMAGDVVLNKATPEKSPNGSGSVENFQVSPVSMSYSHFSQVQNKAAEKGCSGEINNPALKAKFNRVSAAVKGYLTRRLMKTERVQGIIQTIKDTLVCAVRFHEETPVKTGRITEQDADLHQRLISQITAACCELHDIFFKISTKERMMIISQSREFARERNKEDKDELYLTQKNSAFKRSPRSKTRPALSSATIKYLERKNSRSSSEGKNVGLSAKSKASVRAVQKRPVSASGRRTQLSPPASVRNSKYTPYAKNNTSTKGSAKNAKSVRRLTYSRADR